MAEKAESLTLTMGGAGLSSYAVPDGNFLFVWSVQVFPMLDIGNVVPNMQDMALRSAHYYEFDDLKYRKQGFLHRTGYQYSAQGTAPAPVTEVYSPMGGADIMPVFWNFKGQFLTCRIWHMPQAAPVIMDVPPSVEGQSSGPYPPATPLLSLWQTGGAGQNWEPDARRDQTGANRSPRPFSIAANEINVPAYNPNIGTAWPLVNLQIVSYPAEFQKSFYE